MSIKADFTELNSLKSLLSLCSKPTQIAEKIAQRGKELAEENYAGTDVVVSVEKGRNGKYKVVAEGDDVIFMEFGTGIYADGSYPGKLPTEPITFVSAHHHFTTPGWVYYYDNKYTKRTQNGAQGWIHKGVFKVGNKAMAQMWHTGVALSKEIGGLALLEILEKKND